MASYLMSYCIFFKYTHNVSCHQRSFRFGYLWIMWWITIKLTSVRARATSMVASRSVKFRETSCISNRGLACSYIEMARPANERVYSGQTWSARQPRSIMKHFWMYIKLYSCIFSTLCRSKLKLFICFLIENTSKYRSYPFLNKMNRLTLT